MELTKEEAEENLLRLMYNSAAWKVHQQKIEDLMNAERAAIAGIVLHPVTDTTLLNLHISRLEGMEMVKAIPSEVVPDSDPAEALSV